jgi:enoyl-CoA hydratase/carnithine racemase
MADEQVLVQRDGRFASIAMNRPERRNALSTAMLTDLRAAFRQVAETDAAGIVLSGAGPVFSAGHDFRDVHGRDLLAVRELLLLCADLMRTIQSVPQVVVARVHGLATAAGCQLVASCDLAVAGESAAFAVPGGKGGWFCHTPMVAVARNVGRKRAMELALTGEPIDAERGAELGLVNRLAEPGGAVAAARQLAAQVVANGPLALAASKRVLVEAPGWPEGERWARQAEIVGPVRASEDAREGARAFAEKRTPVWRAQ